MTAGHRFGRAVSVLVAIAAIVAACEAGTPSPASVSTPSLAAPSRTTTPFVVPALTSTFTSDLYGYTIRYPGFFDARAATEELQGAAVPAIDSDVVDLLIAPDGAVVVMSSGVLPTDTTLDEWTAITATGFCGSPTTSEPVEVGGEPGTLSTFASCAGLFHQWATAVHDGRGYHVIWAKDRGTETNDRALYMAMLATFAFGAGMPAVSGTPGPTTSGLRRIEPGGPIPESLLGTWYHAAPAYFWVLRAGDASCMELVKTSQDCALWKWARWSRVDMGILTILDGRLAIHWKAGGCAGTSIYAFGDSSERVTLRRVSGCESGDLALSRIPTAGTPTAPPAPGS